MNNPAFIVDGQMEKKIIDHFCPEKPVRLLNCNGRDVTLKAAAKKIASLIRLMKRNTPIIIIFDKEKRNDSADNIALKLLSEIKEQKIHDVDILIGVPDIMMENWMLASIDGINSYYNLNYIQKNFEGKNGKAKLKAIIKPRIYHETEDGPEIIKRCDIKNIYINSHSFKTFCDKIKYLNCAMLKMPNFT
jgi:hypothetical protein